MNFNKNDLMHVRNIATALNKATYTFGCDEALAFARAIEWFAKFGNVIKAQVEQAEAASKQAPAQPPAPAPVPVPEPVAAAKPKRSKKSGDK